MKTKINNYTFDASLKTITFGDYETIDLERILVITNVTDNIIIYNFTDPSAGGTVADNVLTLAYNTTTMADGDKLSIYYDDDAESQNVTIASRNRPRIYLPYYLSAIGSTIVGVQTKLLLGSIDITKAGDSTALIKVYDNYYQAVNEKARFAGDVVGNHVYPGDGIFLAAGCFVVISGVTSPHVTINLAPYR